MKLKYILEIALGVILISIVFAIILAFVYNVLSKYAN
jgi:hypothetical protein